jgi:excinuclease UvrABC nuclease subunit
MMTNKFKKWAFIPMVLSSRRSIPKISGVYAINRVKRIEGLPINIEVLYIGKSNNLWRRFEEHLDPTKEHNLEVNKSIRWGAPIEFWYFSVKESGLKHMEELLIQKIEPKYNIIRYGDKNA